MWLSANEKNPSTYPDEIFRKKWRFDLKQLFTPVCFSLFSGCYFLSAFTSLFRNLFTGGNFNRIWTDYYRKLSLMLFTRCCFFFSLDRSHSFSPNLFFIVIDLLILHHGSSMVNIDVVVYIDVKCVSIFSSLPCSIVSVISDDNKQSAIEHIDSFSKWAEEQHSTKEHTV